MRPLPKPLRFLLGTLVFIALGIFLLYSLDSWIDRHAETAAVEAGLTRMQGNTSKHAFAAGKLFLIFRAVGFSENFSRHTVYRLGILNEWVEYYTTLPSSRDWTPEIMKDLLNNLYGIEIAIASSTQVSGPNTLEYMRHLASLTKQGLLPLDYRDPRIPHADYTLGGPNADPAAAVAWFYREEAALRGEAKSQLSALK